MRKLLLLLFLPLAFAQEYQIIGELQGPFDVTYVYDGDTIQVAGEKVRLLSIDTPESSWNKRTESPSEIPLGERAKEITEQLSRNQVYLEIGIAERDRYGRVLAWVYYRDPSGQFVKGGARYNMINYELVRRGWADVFIIPPNVRYESIFEKAIAEARKSRLGMWADSIQSLVPTSPVKIKCVVYNPPGEDVGHEKVILYANSPTALNGYIVGDDDGYRMPLSGSYGAGEIAITLDADSPQLSNRGDTVLLWRDGEVVDKFSYRGRRGETTACRSW